MFQIFGVILTFPQHIRACKSKKSSDGQPISTGNEMQVSFPMAGNFDFMCINTDKSLAPIIMPADIIALKKYATWETYIPGDFICVVVTKDFKVLRKVSPKQDDEQ